MGIIEEYNYDSFIPEKFGRWLKFDSSPPVGISAPDFKLTDLNGEEVKLSQIWRDSTFTVVEFGSLT